MLGRGTVRSTQKTGRSSRVARAPPRKHAPKPVGCSGSSVRAREGLIRPQQMSGCEGHEPQPRKRRRKRSMKEIGPEIEELEERIAPSAIGDPVPAGAKPQPRGGYTTPRPP